MPVIAGKFVVEDPKREEIERPDLQWITDFWVEKLKLQDVRVYIRYGNHEQTGEGQAGANSLYLQENICHITILDPLLSDDKHLWWIDVEETVVHELVHIHIDKFFSEGNAGHKWSRAEYLVVEQTVNLFANTLVEYERERRKVEKILVPRSE